MIADTIRAVQRGLIAHGFSVGKSGADGALGKQTRAALTAYQKANGLHPSGQADGATIAALLQPATPKPNLRPQQVGQMMDSPFASRSTEAPPPPSPGGQVAGSVSPSPPGSPPPLSGGLLSPEFNRQMDPRSGPPFGPADNRTAPQKDYAGMWNTSPELRRMYPQPPAGGIVPQSDPAAELQARQALEKAIWDALIGLRIQPQANQPAYSDQYATPSPPPAFAPPMGAYR